MHILIRKTEISGSTKSWGIIEKTVTHRNENLQEWKSKLRIRIFGSLLIGFGDFFKRVISHRCLVADILKLSQTFVDPTKRGIIHYPSACSLRIA